MKTLSDIYQETPLPENVREDGDCYEAAAKEVLFNDKTKILVHADILPRLGGPGIGKPYGHAWVEKGNMVWDVSNNHKGEMGEMFRNGVQKDFYYGIADPSNIKTYTAQETAKLINQYKHWGPWPTNEGFQLIDKELSESRLFRATRGFSTLDGKEVADLFYLLNLALYLLHNEKDTLPVANKFAKKTTMYSTYSLFRTHGSDLYLLAYQILNPANDHVNMRDPKNSKAFLNGCKFHSDQHIKFLRKMYLGNPTSAEVISYFFRLEKQLKISDPRFFTWRRSITTWPNQSSGEQKDILKQLVREIKRRGFGGGRSSELYSSLISLLDK